VRDLAGLMECKVEAVGPVCGVGGENGVYIVGLGGVEAVGRIWLVCVRLTIVAVRVFGCGVWRDGCHWRFVGERRGWIA
jgi:hypothetical protein